MRRATAGLVTGMMVAAGLLLLGPPAQAAGTYATVENVSFNPAETDFSDQNAALSVTVTVDMPASWRFDHGDLLIYDLNGNPLPNWLNAVHESQDGQTDTVTFSGQVPNQYGGLNRGYIRVTPSLQYKDGTAGPDVPATDNNYWFHLLAGDTKATLDGAPNGSALRLSGRLTCFHNTDYVAPGVEGWVDIYYSDPGANDWQYAASDSVNSDTGNWSHTLPFGGDAHLDWQARLNAYPTCANSNSPILTINSGSTPPPPPPGNLPGAPGLSVASKTLNTVSLSWSPPTSNADGITGYRFGWESDSGIPQPSWSDVFGVNADNPFKMTHLCAGCTYHMWIEAVTNRGTGDRARVDVTTDSAPTPPPPPPSLHRPGKPRSVHARAGNHKALVSWRHGTTGGGTIDQYQVRRHGKIYPAASRPTRLTVRGLVNHKLYTFAVRAHNAAGWSGWSRSVNVRPHG